MTDNTKPSAYATATLGHRPNLLPRNASGQAKTHGNALDELASVEIRETVYSIFQFINRSVMDSGFPSLDFKSALAYAAKCSDHCTRINANALDYAMALLYNRHNYGQQLFTPLLGSGSAMLTNERTQKIYVGCTALESTCGTKEYKELIFAASKEANAHLQLPYEAFMNYAFSVMAQCPAMLAESSVYNAWTTVLHERQKVEQARAREVQTIEQLALLAKKHNVTVK